MYDRQTRITTIAMVGIAHDAKWSLSNSDEEEPELGDSVDFLLI